MGLAILECSRLGPRGVALLGEFFRALRESGSTRHFHPHPLTDDEAANRVAYSGQDLYAALVDDSRVLGYGMLRGWDKGHEVPSLGIAIRPDARGLGLGMAMMHFLQAAARLRGARRVRLKVHADNLVACRLYEQLGYRFEGEEDGQRVGYIEL